MHIGALHQTFHAKGSFTFCRFLGKNVSFKCFLKGDFSCSGHLKALLGAGVCFYFWHYIICLRLLPTGGTAQAAHLLGRVGIRAAKVGENVLATNNKIKPVFKKAFYEPGKSFSWHHLLRRTLERSELC